MLQLIENAKLHQDRTAIKSEGQSYTFKHVLTASESIAAELLQEQADLKEARIAFLVQPGFDYVRIQWAIWRAGGIAVPLCVKHPLRSIQYVIDDTDAAVIIYAEEFYDLLSPLLEKTSARVLQVGQFVDKKSALPVVDSSRRAMILYTSGTTGNPKGVVTTHNNIETQIKSLTSSWEWAQDDHILNVLPLHHVHGIINVMSCAFWSGACCSFLPKFSPKDIFSIFKAGEVNVFMAVPTIYYKLIHYWSALTTVEQNDISSALKTFRLMVSGSAALPISVLEQWKEISGHILLERYGMTEMGMAISNPYREERRPGHIGQPLDGVHIRIADESNQIVEPGQQGEIQVKGANVFKEYWNKPEETAKTFTDEGWFKTGDIALLDDGYYRILGRQSVDIIKSGGYKISALEIEEVLRTHPHINDCGVVGLPDEEWGEIIGACLIADESHLDIDSLKQWLSDKLASYKMPRKFIFQKDLPRNVMGKVTKNDVKTLF